MHYATDTTLAFECRVKEAADNAETEREAKKAAEKVIEGSGVVEGLAWACVWARTTAFPSRTILMTVHIHVYHLTRVCVS